MAYKMFSTGLVFALAGMCMCQAASNTPSQYQSLQAVSQSSFQSGPAVVPQTRLEDIERDSSKPSQASIKSAGPSPAASPLQAQQQPAAGQVLAYPQQQYFVQPYQGQQQQYLAQQYPAPFDYSGVQYMFINPTAYNQAYQPYYVQTAQPSAVPQYVTKSQNGSPAASSQSTSAASPTSNQGPVEFKQQFASTQGAPAAAAAPSLAGYKQVQYVEAAPAPAFQYVPQPAVNPAEFAYVTRHPSTAQFKTSAPTAAAAQPQFQYAAIPQQFQQPQFYFNVPQQQTYSAVPQQQTFSAVPQQQTFSAIPQQQTFSAVPVEQTRVQPSVKSQFSSGIKSTTASPTKGSDFAYKFESSPPQSQSSNTGAYSTLRF
ncbi:uncharacterized protein LOC126834486 [Adelges cooleyi]|uniref:uncharacterized protein LOC126834486 n=1 Tax=Adelges cooleyi TaxID=133065 RepID=UPI00217F5748|nr:uncharacterized protein LOC126834486 [Adelges cooleyi]